MTRASRRLAVLTVLLTGCGTDPDVFHTGCYGRQVDVRVGTGLNPTISWSPDCEVGALTVREYPDSVEGQPRPPGATMWTVRSHSNIPGPNNLLTPPVRYGVTPSGGEASLVGPLVAGTTYLVVLVAYEFDGSGFGSRFGSAVGSKEFKP